MNRRDVFQRDGCRCVYCGEAFDVEELTVDHVQPKARGGDNSAGNVVTACGGCNTRKGHRRLSDFLLAEPVARAHFFRLATHVWARQLRVVEEEMAHRARRARP